MEVVFNRNFGATSIVELIKSTHIIFTKCTSIDWENEQLPLVLTSKRCSRQCRTFFSSFRITILSKMHDKSLLLHDSGSQRANN